jgi:hypothetical protein
MPLRFLVTVFALLIPAVPLSAEPVQLDALSIAGAFASQAVAEQTPPAAGQRRRRPRSGTNRGVPKGVQACIDRLIEIASADPLPAYGGQAEEIINNGLLWNDPKSRCSLGDNHALRMKVFEVVKAWRAKDAGTVRSLLQEVKSAAPQG